MVVSEFVGSRWLSTADDGYGWWFLVVAGDWDGRWWFVVVGWCVVVAGGGWLWVAVVRRCLMWCGVFGSGVPRLAVVCEIGRGW